jgi:hypothetical protein
MKVIKKASLSCARKFNAIGFNTVRGFLDVQKAKGFGAVFKAGTSENLRGGKWQKSEYLNLPGILT